MLFDSCTNKDLTTPPKAYISKALISWYTHPDNTCQAPLGRAHYQYVDWSILSHSAEFHEAARTRMSKDTYLALPWNYSVAMRYIPLAWLTDEQITEAAMNDSGGLQYITYNKDMTADFIAKHPIIYKMNTRGVLTNVQFECIEDIESISMASGMGTSPLPLYVFAQHFLTTETLRKFVTRGPQDPSVIEINGRTFHVQEPPVYLLCEHPNMTPEVYKLNWCYAKNPTNLILNRNFSLDFIVDELQRGAIFISSDFTQLVLKHRSDELTHEHRQAIIRYVVCRHGMYDDFCKLQRIVVNVDQHGKFLGIKDVDDEHVIKRLCIRREDFDDVVLQT